MKCIDLNQIYIERLEKRGVKPTAMRILILRAVTDAVFPVSLADLEEKLETVDKSTIFRILTLFLNHHLIHGIEDGSGSLKYEACAGECECSVKDMHAHFYCRMCHRTFCFKNIHIPLIDLPKEFVMEGVNYMVKGICADCAKKRLP